MVRGVGILAGLALLIASAAQAEVAEPTPLVPLQTADATKGWEAVGRLNFGTAAYCTGALIAEDIVLTAAHCLFDSSEGTKFGAEDIEFLAGWRNGQAQAYRGVARVFMHPDFTFSTTEQVSRVAHDLALLKLDQPIRNPSIAPFAVDAQPEKGASVGVVSYAEGRSDAPSLQESCDVMAHQGGVLVLSCTVDHGASGSPIFMLQEGEAPRIVSIVSAMAKVRSRTVALGTALTQPLEVLHDLMAAEGRLDEPQEPEIVSRNLPVVRSLPGTGNGGAKFLKPTN